MDSMSSKDIQTRIIDDNIFVKVGMDKWRVLFINKIRYIDIFDKVTTVMFTDGSFLMINDSVKQIISDRRHNQWLNVVAVRRCSPSWLRPTYEYFTEEVITKNEDVYWDDVEKLLEEFNNDEKVEGI